AVDGQRQDRAVAYKGASGPNGFNPGLVSEFLPWLEARVGAGAAKLDAIAVFAAATHERHAETAIEQSVPILAYLILVTTAAHQFDGVNLAQDQIRQRLTEEPAHISRRQRDHIAPHDQPAFAVTLIRPVGQSPITPFVGAVDQIDEQG